MIKYPYGSWTAPLPTLSKIKKFNAGWAAPSMQQHSCKLLDTGVRHLRTRTSCRRARSNLIGVLTCSCCYH